MRENKRAAFLSLGCKVNEYETERLKESFHNAGYEIVLFSEQADVYVINSCTVTAEADRKSRQMVRRARKENPSAVVVCAGCFSESAVKKLGEDQLFFETGADIIAGNAAKSDIISLVEKFETTHERIAYLPDINEKGLSYERTEIGPSPKGLITEGGRVRAFLKIQDGCDRFCSYCLIPFARGRSRSRDLSAVASEAKEFFESGRREIVLTGINLSSYKGPRGESLFDVAEEVIDEISDLPGGENFRLRLGSLEPNSICEDTIKRLSKKKALCPHFHLSLQSGSDSVLQRMNRHYTKEEFLSSVKVLREYFDDPAITADIICGFPGETKSEFEETLLFAEEVGFAKIHAFPFSAREGTKAALMDGQVKKSERLYRTGKLIELQNCLREGYVKRNIGKEAAVLIEEKEDSGGSSFFSGYTERYIRALVPAGATSEKLSAGRIVKGAPKSMQGNDCLIIDKDFIIL